MLQDPARRQMVDQQVRAWDVFDPLVLDAMTQVRRECFVPAIFQGVAFADAPVQLGHGQIMLPPSLDGRILAALNVVKSDEVLDVGTGSGFLAACLGRLGARVRSLEIYPDLAERATANLLAAAANNVVVDIADALQLSDESRFDVIAVSGSVTDPGSLADNRFARALRPGGRLFLVTGQAPAMQARRIVRLSATEWRQEVIFETSVMPLVNGGLRSHFVF
ncbi:MAG TPA: protein-L-isoaspartate O-methyltransferase [Steroidobacteraceae bacterium]|nr:protein-L-isoaspartate O-methyltransferase [Steroidobacteraceae bacterium]